MDDRVRVEWLWKMEVEKDRLAVARLNYYHAGPHSLRSIGAEGGRRRRVLTRCARSERLRLRCSLARSARLLARNSLKQLLLQHCHCRDHPRLPPRIQLVERNLRSDLCCRKLCICSCPCTTAHYIVCDVVDLSRVCTQCQYRYIWMCTRNPSIHPMPPP